MENNDTLIRLRYALDIRDLDMVEIFKLGGIEVTKEEVLKILTKSDDNVDNEDHIHCDDHMLDSFFNGFIIFNRGVQKPKPGEPKRQAPPQNSNENMNNVIFKKLRIALTLTSDDIIDIMKLAGVTMTQGELSAILRNKNHRNYTECGGGYARNFLKGLTIKHRK